MRQQGALYSGIFHAVILLLAILGLPEWLHREIEEQPSAISVELLPISELSNVPNVRKVTKEVKKEPPKEEPTKEKEPPKPVEAESVNKMPTPQTSQQKSESAPEPEKVPLEKTEQKPEVKKEEKPKEDKPKKEDKKKDKKEEADELDAVLKSLQTQAQQKTSESTEKPKETSATSPSRSDLAFNPDAEPSLSEQDAIRSQIQRNWSPPFGSENIVVSLRIQILEDGMIHKVEIVEDGGRYHTDALYRVAAEAARRAVIATQRLVGLKPKRYDVILDFDPKDML